MKHSSSICSIVGFLHTYLHANIKTKNHFYDNVFNRYFLYLTLQVHVNLMILEARNQAELLYALREVMRYMT